MELADAKTAIEDLNSARYYLCFLAWDAGDYYDAAVLGEFLARHIPTVPPAGTGRGSRWRSFVRLYGERERGRQGFRIRRRSNASPT